MKRATAICVLLLCSGGMSLSVAAQPAGLEKAERDFLVGYLEETRRQLLDGVSGLSEAQTKFKSSPDKWSVAEIVEHLVNAENVVFDIAQRIVKSPPPPPELRRMIEERIMKLPAPGGGAGARGLMVKDQAIILTATNRTTRRFQAPDPVAPRGKLTAKAELIGAFTEARGRTIAYLETTNDDLRGHFSDHWVLGVIDAYQWLLFVTAHSERHLAQLGEVKSHPNFPPR